MNLEDDQEHPEEKTLLAKSRSSSVSAALSTGISGPPQKWLLAHNDPLAGIYTFSSCICFADLNGDGDNKLILADFGSGVKNMKLNIYRGTSLQTQLALVDIPAGVASFHMDTGSSGNVPSIAVASGSFLYVYKNLKPFYKFQLPPIELNAMEVDAWAQVKEEKINVSAMKEIIESLRTQVGEIALTAKSQAFLNLVSLADMEEFIEKYKFEPLKNQTIITCLTTMKKSHNEENAVSCLVIGTENRDIFVVEPEAFTVLATVQLPSVPVFIEVNGLFDVDYRLIVSCRDAHIYTIKRGFKTGRLCVQLTSQPSGILRINNNIIVATMDAVLYNYNSKGNCMWNLKLPFKITAIVGIEIDVLGLRLIAVAVESHQVYLYHDKHRVDTIETDDVVTSMKFGRYGREDCTLVMVTRNGALQIRILKRTAKFQAKDISGDSVPSSIATKLNIPKKTKLFVDQTMRERDESITIHRTFQQDLYRLRLNTARAYVKAITTSLNPISTNAVDSLKLSAQVHGLGPTFKLVLELQNTSVDQASMNLYLTFQCDVRIYDVERNYIPVAFLQPGFVYTFATKVNCVSELNVADIIKVFVVKEGDCVPLITAVINMPASEAPI
ncbi:Bardet-Biedl syndrome 1 protein [Halotydeus destructor]|nr:Bardet-Biedl syndrome 1 protein [Halotydeus destructor]